MGGANAGVGDLPSSPPSLPSPSTLGDSGLFHSSLDLNLSLTLNGSLTVREPPGPRDASSTPGPLDSLRIPDVPLPQLLGPGPNGGDVSAADSPPAGGLPWVRPLAPRPSSGRRTSIAAFPARRPSALKPGTGEVPRPGAPQHFVRFTETSDRGRQSPAPGRRSLGDWPPEASSHWDQTRSNAHQAAAPPPPTPTGVPPLGAYPRRSSMPAALDSARLARGSPPQPPGPVGHVGSDGGDGGWPVGAHSPGTPRTQGSRPSPIQHLSDGACHSPWAASGGGHAPTRAPPRPDGEHPPVDAPRVIGPAGGGHHARRLPPLRPPWGSLSGHPQTAGP